MGFACVLCACVCSPWVIQSTPCLTVGRVFPSQDFLTFTIKVFFLNLKSSQGLFSKCQCSLACRIPNLRVNVQERFSTGDFFGRLYSCRCHSQRCGTKSRVCHVLSEVFSGKGVLMCVSRDPGLLFVGAGLKEPG